jgi:ribonuclease BN (tRNA processing enzyme)
LKRRDNREASNKREPQSENNADTTKKKAKRVRNGGKDVRMKIKFVGVGSAFTTADYFQSNMLVFSRDGGRLLIDCGTDIRFSLRAVDIINSNLSEKIQAIYISHLHSDHIGGMEWLAFNTYFGPRPNRPVLYSETQTMYELWDNSLVAGLGCIEGKRMHLTDYFDCRPLDRSGSFEWGGIRFTLHQMPHIQTGYKNMYSYGLLMKEIGRNGPSVFLSTDTQFYPELIGQIAGEVSMIFHDCETAPFKSLVHAHYDELRALPKSIRNKMWLYHYQPNPTHDPRKDGFIGFVGRGQEFDFTEELR